MWKFECYITSGGVDVIDEWLSQQDAAVRAEVDALLEYLQKRPIQDWDRPKYAPLKGVCSGLGEIRIKVKSGQYRLLGFFGLSRHVFTFLTCFKKQRDSDTDRACKIGQRRKKEIENGQAKTVECTFP